MLHKRLSLACVIVKRNYVIKDGCVTCLTHIGACAGNEPERVIVKAASDVGIALFGEGLVLMVCASVLKLCGGYINYSLSCTIRNEVNEAKKILT